MTFAQVIAVKDSLNPDSDAPEITAGEPNTGCCQRPTRDGMQD